MPEITDPNDFYDWDEEFQMWVTKDLPPRVSETQTYRPCVVTDCSRRYLGSVDGGLCFEHENEFKNKSMEQEQLRKLTDWILEDVFGADEG